MAVLCAGVVLLAPNALAQATAGANWQAIGPTAASTSSFGLVTGRITALALDPTDTTGNRLYVGTTGGGVWFAQNAGSNTLSAVSFSPLTDAVNALSGASDATLSIGALSAQPGGTGVILAGTGDPNDALDSYYGAGILYSANGGSTWSLIPYTVDLSWGFVGESFAGFAWSTDSPQTVVAAVSQAYEGTLVNAVEPGVSSQGLYYSTQGGQPGSWQLATISDGAGSDVQGPSDVRALPDGNAATAVVWNKWRHCFIAAVRFHGYYQSSDGTTWTRLAEQPGANLTAKLCPTNAGLTGSPGCPIFRGALAVNPLSGDTFAWSIDIYNQDQGLWQDACTLNGTACANQSMTFAKQLGTAALESNTDQGAATIANGDYTLALAAVPYAAIAGADTILLAGGDDLWKCSLAAGCVWRNTTNSATCRAAQVGAYQHALAWNAANPDEIFIGNDSGLWRSTDQAGVTGSDCNASDASHFQNLNGGLGSLAEVLSLTQSAANPYALMAGLGVNGTVGVDGTAAPSGDWTQILTGQGGPSAIDTVSGNWLVNDGAGVSMAMGMAAAGSLPDSFSRVLDYSTTPLPLVVEDGLTMDAPAPFLIDPLDHNQLLIATCRLWRGPASGAGWTAANAVSPILDGGQSAYCSGDALIRSLAAMVLGNGTEAVYVGMYGASDGGGILPGHIWSAVIDPQSASAPLWTDLTFNPVSNDIHSLNYYGLDISSLVIDPHDATGKTVYAMVAGMASRLENVLAVYRSSDGGAHWSSIEGNLPTAPVNSLAVDPQDANTVYLGTDLGVWATRQIGNCATPALNCWSVYGAGLPLVPVSALSASASASLLTAATYGRGLWQIPLWSSGQTLTTATVEPTALTFASQAQGTTSSSQTVTLTNTGRSALTVTGIAASGDFARTENCSSAAVGAGAQCTIQVTFTPTAPGSRTGQLTIGANVAGGQLLLALSGTGTAPLAVSVNPPTLSFGSVAEGATAPVQTVTLNNAGVDAVAISAVAISPSGAPFAIVSNTSNGCGSVLAAGASCPEAVDFAPTAAGSFTATLTFTDAAGTQTVALTGNGEAVPREELSPPSLSFSSTAIGQSSPPQTVTLSNGGGGSLTGIGVAASGPFQATNYCGAQLTGGISCSIDVVYVPTAAASQSGSLTVTADTQAAQAVALTGAGVAAAAISVSPISLNFGAQAAGTTSPPQTLTISNSGGAPLANLSFQLAGAAASSFNTGVTTCGTVLTNGASCTLQVSYAPAGSGGSVAALVIASSTAGVAAVSVPLTGNGAAIAPALQVTPAALSLGVVAVGQTGSASTVTIANLGTAASLNNLNLTVTPGFQLTSNTCTATLAALANCSVGVVIAPSNAGAQTGTLTVTSSTVAATTVALSGTGFSFTLSAVSPSQTVTGGQPASYTLAIAPQGGVQQTYTFTCGTLPAYASCGFSPASEALSANGSAGLAISTGTLSVAGAPRWSPALPLLCALLGVPLAWRLPRRLFRTLLLAVLLGMLLGGVGSCTASGGGGGGGGGGGSGATTPAGSYSVVVTATAGGLSQSVTLTLVVD